VLSGGKIYDIAVDRNLVARPRTIAKPGGPPRQGYPAGLDPGFDFAARAVAGGGKKLLQPFALRVSRWCR